MDFLRANTSGLEYTLSTTDDLAFSISGNDYTQKVALNRAYAEFEEDPADRDEVFARWKAFVDQLRLGAALDPADVVPMIKDRAWLRIQEENGVEEGGANAFWVDGYNEDLLVVYAEHRSGFSFRPRQELMDAGITPEEIRDLALRNLRGRTEKRDFYAVGRAWAINAGGNFEASLLLDEELWSNHRFRGAPEVLAAVPERDSLLASTDVSPWGVWFLAAMASHGFRNERYPISPHLMTRREGLFRLLDPLVEDESHPIPNLDVIDVHVEKKEGGSTMIVVIASPLAADPRSIFRLYRKMDGHLQFLKTAAYRDQCGAGETEIEINIHRDSDPQVFELLSELKGFIEQRGARLSVRHRTRPVPLTQRAERSGCSAVPRSRDARPA